MQAMERKQTEEKDELDLAMMEMQVQVAKERQAVEEFKRHLQSAKESLGDAMAQQTEMESEHKRLRELVQRREGAILRLKGLPPESRMTL